MFVSVLNMVVYIHMKTRNMAWTDWKTHFHFRWSRESSAAERCWYTWPNDTKSSDSCRWLCWWVSSVAQIQTDPHFSEFLFTVQQHFSRFRFEDLINFLKCTSYQNDAWLPLFPILCCQQTKAEKHRRNAEVNLNCADAFCGQNQDIHKVLPPDSTPGFSVSVLDSL